jgi:hypothetical protein
MFDANALQNILTCRRQSSAHYHQPVMGLICCLMAEKLRLKFTHLSYRNYLQQDCQSAKQRVRTVLDNHWAQISLNMFQLIFSLIVLFWLQMGIYASSFSWAVKSPSCKERSKLQHITWSTLIYNIFCVRSLTASKAWERIRGLQFNPPLRIYFRHQTACIMGQKS